MRSTVILGHDGGSQKGSRMEDAPHISGSNETQIHGNQHCGRASGPLFRSESEHKEAVLLCSEPAMLFGEGVESFSSRFSRAEVGHQGRPFTARAYTLVPTLCLLR